MNIESGPSNQPDIASVLQSSLEKIATDGSVFAAFITARNTFNEKLVAEAKEKKEEHRKEGYSQSDIESVPAWWMLWMATPPDGRTMTEDQDLTTFVHDKITAFLDEFLTEHDM